MRSAAQPRCDLPADPPAPGTPPKPSAARVLGHKPESVTFNGETWDIVCACSWECWNVEDVEEAWESFNDHIFDDVRTAISRMRDEAKVTNLV